MRNKSILLLIVITLLCFSSCLHDHPDTVEARDEIKVTASIGSENHKGTVNTRAKDNSWDEGDAIGIFMKKNDSTLSTPSLVENAKYITDGSDIFTPASPKVIYFPFDNTKVDFIAYYPYKETLNGIEYKIDLNDQSDLSKIDLLYSNNVTAVNRSSEKINLVFKHQLANVILNFSLDNPETPLTGLEAEISNINTLATFLLTDGSIKEEKEPKSIAFKVSEDGKKAQAILLPTTDLTGKQLIIKHNKLSYTIELNKLETLKAFVKSTRHTFNIKIIPPVGVIVDTITSSVEDWITGPSEDITVTEGLPVDEVEGGGTVEGDGDPEGEAVGDGTKDNPYSIAQAKEIKSATKVWVKGYIVGSFGLMNLTKEKFVAGKTLSGNSLNIGIADSSSEINAEMVFPADFDNGAVSVIQKALNISDNSDNLYKLVYLHGDIKVLQQALCITNIKEAILEGKLYR